MPDRLSASDLKVAIYADGAELESIRKLASNPLVKGFTTNPTLMRKAGITDYEAFCKNVLEFVTLPISFEVFADDSENIERQARLIASWGSNVFVKIPVTTTDGTSTGPLVKSLAADGVQQNVTALMTVRQVEEVAGNLASGPDAFVSVFAGRIADTGRDPIPAMKASLAALAATPQLRLIWASPREVLNVVQASEIGCHVITVTHDLLAKLNGFGKNLDQFSLETVQMFANDAVASGFTL